MDFVHHGEAETGGCVGFGVAKGFVFGFNHHRGAVGGGNQFVQLEAGASLDQLGILGAHLTAGPGQHGAQQVAQLVIGAGFAVSGALGGHGSSGVLRGEQVGEGDAFLLRHFGEPVFEALRLFGAGFSAPLGPAIFAFLPGPKT